MTARLLLVPALHIGLAADSLAVRNLGRLQIDFGVVALLEFRDDHFDVLLAGSGNQEFFGLRIAEEAQHGVFFHQFVDAGPELVFVGAALGLDRERDRRFRQVDLGILDGRGLVAERVSGQRIAQLGDRPNIAGMQFIHRNGVLALHDRDVRQLLLRITGEVLHRGFVLQYAAVDLEVRNSPGERIGHGLEYEKRKSIRIRNMPLGSLSVAARDPVQRSVFRAHRGVIDQEVH